MTSIALVLFSCAAVGLVLLCAQAVALHLHLGAPRAAPRIRPPVSVLKPLCGVDDGLEASLGAFACLDYPEYEVLLGVRSPADAAFPLACRAARRWPRRFRVVVQRGAPGMNPKVNQLVTLARSARHDLLVVSDSNVRVDPGYLTEIAALLEDDRVGLVTHAVVGVGERRLGSLMDALHLAGAIAPGVVAAKRLARCDIVVGKSMALRRADLERLGGFEAVKDVLAEDYVMGRMISSVLDKRVEVARRPVQNVTERCTVSQFAARYRRWSVMQRQAVGSATYAAAVVLNPVLLAAIAAAVEHTPNALAGFAGVCAAKTTVDGFAARALRPGGFRLTQLAVTPVKDLVFGASWAYGLVRREIEWRGTRLAVGRGTRIEPAASRARGAAGERLAGA